jgi:hypothetical protein
MSAHQRLVIVRVNSRSSPEQLAFRAIYRKQDYTAMAAANRVLKQLEVFLSARGYGIGELHSIIVEQGRVLYLNVAIPPCGAGQKKVES